MDGVGEGFFTFELVVEIGDTTQEKVTFSNVYVTENTKSVLEFNTIEEVEELMLDHNNDGEMDAVAFTDEYTDQIVFDDLILEIEKLPTKIKTALLKKAENAKKSLNKGNNIQTIRLLESIQKQVIYFSEQGSEKVKIDKMNAIRIELICNILIQ